MSKEIDTKNLLTQEELDEIDKKVLDDVVSIWEEDSAFSPLLWTYCSRCPGTSRQKLKTRCIGRMDTLETLCVQCWAKEHEQKLIEEAVRAKKPKLDVGDFARV